MKIIKLSMTRLYLLQGEKGRWTLIDTGYSHEYGSFLTQLRKRGIPPEEIDYLFLTHHHDDHSGFLAQLIENRPEIRIIARREAEPLLAVGHNSTANGGSLLNRRISALFKVKRLITPAWDLCFPPVRLRSQDIRLGEDRTDLRDVLGFQAEAVYTPGHSSDSQSLLLPEGLLFCGDMTARFLNFAGAKYCTLFNEDIEQVYRTWGSVLKLGVRRLYPAHGRDFSSLRLEQHMQAHSPASVVPFPD